MLVRRDDSEPQPVAASFRSHVRQRPLDTEMCVCGNRDIPFRSKHVSRRIAQHDESGAKLPSDSGHAEGQVVAIVIGPFMAAQKDMIDMSVGTHLPPVEQV